MDTSQSLKVCNFTLRLTLGIVLSIGLGKCVMPNVHHYNIIQSIFTGLKIISALSLYFPLPLTPGNR